MMVINVHSKKSPEILKAIYKGGTLEQAKEIGRQLWKISQEPYIFTVCDMSGEQLFIHKI